MILYNASNFSQSFIHLVQRFYKGSVTTAPAPGTQKYLEYLAVANMLQADWCQDSDVLWNSLFSAREYGPISATEQAYDMDSDVFYLSDGLSILRLDGNTDWFRVVQPKNRYDETAGYQMGRGMTAGDFGLPLVYLTGNSSGQGSNLTLNFQNPFQTTQNGNTQTSGDVGGTIQVGVYAQLADLANVTDTVLVDNPYWLVWATAAELARNDPAKQDQLPNLVGKANDVYMKMVTANQGNSYEQPNGPRYILPQIGETFDRMGN